jgi:two-component system, LuxR family, sensor kinase FixL
MVSLQQFANFVRSNKLDELAEEELDIFKAFNIPLMEHFKGMSEKLVFDLTKQSLGRFLTSLENGNALILAQENLNNWKNDQIPGIKKEQVSLPDIILIYSAQKIALCKFIPAFTHDVQVATSVIIQLEEYYKEVQEMAVRILTGIQLESHEKMKDSEEKYKDLFDNAYDMIHIVSPEGNIIYVNNAWLQTLEYEFSELKGKSIYSFIFEGDREKYRNYRELIIRNEKNDESITVTFLTKTGKEVICEGYVSCKFRDGKPVYTRGILRDITQRKLNEEKLKFYTQKLEEREENLKQLLDKAPDAVIVINKLGEILLWNRQAENIFGWQSQEVIGKPLADTIIPEQYREAHLQGLKRFLETGEARILNTSIEITALHKQGHEFFISLTISGSSEGNEPIFIAFLRDIARQKKNELELEEQRKQLERTNKEMEQYAWLASHDLKEPLRKILTFSDLLVTRHSEKLPEQTANILQKIRHSAIRMNNLIEDLLMYSNASHEQDNFEMVDLGVLISSILSDLELQIKKRFAVISVDPLPAIEAVPVRMRQLFQNLLSNALKYSKPKQPPEINITCRALGPNFIELVISDNGIGFENEFAEKIFEVFQRLQYNDEYEGTGIGLALCKKIVEAHNGSIRAESEPGNGSRFSIILPTRQPQK